MFENIPYGFTDIYGIKWGDPQVDLYNKVSKEIQDREDNDLPVSEQMLNNRHMIYQIPLYHRKKGEKDDTIYRKRSVHVTFQNGKHLETVISGSKETIKNYYLTNKFNLSSYRDNGKEEPFTTGKSIVFLS